MPILKGFPNPSAPAAVHKNCSRCGEPFTCQQETGCWCDTMRLDSTTLAELRAQYADCLCEACLQQFAAKQK